MPNMKNAKKAVKVINRREISNNEFAASMKNAIKKVDKAVLGNEKDKAKSALTVAIKKIDKAAAKGTTKPNSAARNKARLTKKVNEMN